MKKIGLVLITLLFSSVMYGQTTLKRGVIVGNDNSNNKVRVDSVTSSGLDIVFWGNGTMLSPGGGGSMTWPSSGGIALYSGSSTWGTSIANNSANWNTAYGWGNHAGLYRPIAYVPSWSDITSKPTTLSGFGITDAMSTSHAANAITGTNITNWGTAYTWVNTNGANAVTAYGWGDPKTVVSDTISQRLTDASVGVLVSEMAGILAPYALTSEVGTAYDSAYIHYRVDSLLAVVVENKAEIAALWAALSLGGTVPPRFISAEVGTYADNIVNVLTSATDIDTDSVPSDEAFYFTSNGSEIDVTNVALTTSNVRLTLASTPAEGATLLLNYTAASPYLQNTADDRTIDWVNKPVTNNISSGSVFDSFSSYWKLDETSGSVTDQKALNNLTNYGATPNVTGKLNTAYSFTTNDYIGRIKAYEYTNAVSISSWVYVTATGVDQSIISNFYWNDNGWDLNLNSIQQVEWSVRSSIQTPTEAQAITTTELTPSTWYHIVATFDGTYARVYINGTLSATSSAWNHPIRYDASGLFEIGDRNEGLFFGGRIDEIGIGNFVLTQEEITYLYNSGNGRAYE